MLFSGDGGTRSWLRNSPSCSSAISVRTFRDKQPGFISGRLTSPDSSRLRATSAKHISFNRERQRVSRTHVQITSSGIRENSKTYHLAAFKHFTAELPDWEVPRQPVTQLILWSSILVQGVQSIFITIALIHNISPLMTLSKLSSSSPYALINYLQRPNISLHEQALCDSDEKKLPFNRQKPRGRTGLNGGRPSTSTSNLFSIKCINQVRSVANRNYRVWTVSLPFTLVVE